MNRFSRDPCSYQVYASREVAERMVEWLKGMQIESQVIRCAVCRMVHVLEEPK